ncbi:TPA: hypothetical protein ACXEMK_003883 [Enterobacter roggenkampii]
MDLLIIGVKNHGELDNEYIGLGANKTLNLWDYILADSTYHGDGTTSNKHRHVFDFDELHAITLNKGDVVLLYTRKGKYRVDNISDGSKAYSIYWGLNETIWNKDGDKAILIKVAERIKKDV